MEKRAKRRKKDRKTDKNNKADTKVADAKQEEKDAKKAAKNKTLTSGEMLRKALKFEEDWESPPLSGPDLGNSTYVFCLKNFPLAS